MKREPVVYTSAFVSLMVAAFTLATAFGFDVSQDTQEKIITAGVSIIGALIVLTPLVRQLVYSPASVEKIEAGALPLPAEQVVE